MEIVENKEIVNKYFDAVVSGDIDTIDKLLADDVVVWLPGSLPISGTHSGKQELYKNVFEVVGRHVDPNDKMHFEVTHMIADESCVVAEWTLRRKTDKGKDYENFFMARFEIKDGKIHLIREYLDTLTAKQVMFS